MTLIEIIFCLALTMVAMVGIHHLGIVVFELIKIYKRWRGRKSRLIKWR